jgi:ATP-dependent Clp protease protease subunit
MTTGWPPAGNGAGPPDGGDASGHFRRSVLDHLFEQRIVVVSGRLDHAAGGQAAMEIMTHDADGDEPIRLHLGCPDGELEAALALMDVVELAGVPVEALCIGTVGGAAVGVLAVSATRLGTRTSTIRLRDPGDSFCGSACDQQRWASFRAERWRTFCERLADATGRPADVVADDFEQGRYMTAEQAVEYGVLDRIVERGPEPRRSGLGFKPVR